MEPQQQQPLHKLALHLMVDNDIDRAELMKEFNVKKAAISLALSGQRPTLLQNIYDYLVRKDNERKKLATRPTPKKTGRDRF